MNANPTVPKPAQGRRGIPVPGYVYPAGSTWMSQHPDQLPNGEWVAADGGGLLASSPSLDDLLAKLKGMVFDPAHATIRFNSEDAVA